ARLAGANARINRYTGEFHGISITVLGMEKKSRDQPLCLVTGGERRAGGAQRNPPQTARGSCILLSERNRCVSLCCAAAAHCGLPPSRYRPGNQVSPEGAA